MTLAVLNLDNITDLKRAAVDAMTGHYDNVYELGRALEYVCELYESQILAENNLLDQVNELKQALSDVKAKTRMFALEIENA